MHSQRHSEISQMTGRKSRQHYVTNEQLTEEHRECQRAGRVTEKMAGYFYQIAERYSKHPWFNGYSYREDMVCAALLALIENWNRFDPDKPYGAPDKPKKHNPFAYYTTCCYYVFLRFMNDERREQKIKDELLLDAGYDPSFNYKDDYEQ